MAVKKATVKKAAVKKAPAGKAAKSPKKGDGYECTVCGLAIIIDEECGCVDACDIICCGKQMKPRVRK